jgi:homoserine/homoserine lactone efflux protein
MALIGCGLGALMAAGHGVFLAVQWLGAAYLVWIGIQHWRLAAPGRIDSPPPEAGDDSRRSLLLRGWTVNAVNPKGTVFLLALLPQFVVADRPLLPQYLVIGSTFGVVELCVMSGYVALASRLLGRLRSVGQQRWLNRGFGSLFIAAGLALATFRRTV